MGHPGPAWVDLFKIGKWQEAGHAIRKELESVMETLEGGQDTHTRRLILENNSFVCNQLSIDWDSRNEDSASQDWAKGYHAISELHSLMRVQHGCSPLPLELILSITCNAMWWALMKVDRLHHHCCLRETLARAIYSLNSAGKSVGILNCADQMAGLIETDFIQALKTSTSILTKVSPMVCQLLMEIMILGCLMLFVENIKEERILIELKIVMDHLLECLPQLKVHISWSSGISEIKTLIKFGLREVSEFLSADNISSMSEALVFTKAILHLRKPTQDIKEEAGRALKCLATIDNHSLSFPFLFHYLYALANFNIGNLETCLYHLLQASSSSSNLFMQARASILKGQTLLEQDKAGLALQALFSVEYKHKSIQIPLCPYLIGRAYEKLGKNKQQVEVLNLLLQCLSSNPPIEPRLQSPLVGMEHRFILCVHSQPEISYEEVLQCAVVAYLSIKQPKEAAEKLQELLSVRISQMGNDIEDDKSLRTICLLLHDTASALLEAQSYLTAQKICESAIKFHSRRSENVSGADVYSMKEDVIGLLLLAEAKNGLGVSGVPEILNRCASSFQNLINKLVRSEDKCSETVSLCKALLARIYLHKALLNSKRKLHDDATACFQRALHWKEDDPEVILQFALHLLDTDQHEESLALWAIYQDCDKSFRETDDITIRYLLGQKMGLDVKQEIICRLQSLAH